MKVFTTSLALFTTLISGCVTPPFPSEAPVVVQCATPISPNRAGPAMVGQNYGLSMTPLPLNSVQYGSPATANAMAVQALFAERSPTDTVQVTARFVSCQDVPTSVRIRTSFMRASTAPAEPPSAWKTVYLEPRATALYTEISVARDVASYLVEVAQ